MNIANKLLWSSIPQIEERVVLLISKHCRIPVETIDPQLPLLDFGISSIVAAQINQQVENSFSIELPFELIANGASINTVAVHFYNELSKQHNTLENTAINPIADSSLNRLLRKLSVDPSCAKNRSAEPECTLVHEDLSIESTKQIESTVEFPKKSNIELIKPGAYDVRLLDKYRQVNLQKNFFKKAKVELPYYRQFDSASTDTIVHENQQLINFASYNYLGYTNDPRVNQATIDAILQYGTSAASSRLVSGEKRIHHELEAAIKNLYQVEDSLVFVSGYLTNISVISHLMSRDDLIIHDSLAHNSIVLGCQYSSAKRLKFPHNDMHALENILIENRMNYEQVLIVVEGLYSMDGDTAPLDKLVALKKKYKCLLMVDEAHSIGVLGDNGLGIREHYNVAANDVDIWMGTLSKSFASCGGYIAGCMELISYLKYAVPGIIFSVGMAPPLAAASLKAIELLQMDNSPVKRLHDNSNYLLSLLQKNHINTGLAEGYAIIPCIIGNSLNTARLANTLFYNGLNVQSITYPGVQEHESRLRFFISALHTEEQLNKAAALVAQCFSEYCE